MSLDISVTTKDGTCVSMNWLRNPYGLCQWAEDNYFYETTRDTFGRAPARISHDLWYVINHWNYDKAKRVNKKKFLDVVHKYGEVLLQLEYGYYFFDTSSFIQFVLPHWELIPKRNLGLGITLTGEKLGDTAHLGDQLGLNVEWFKHSAFNLGHPETTMLDKYKIWYKELINLAELLQEPEAIFYCSN